jgi:hypothetical protein
MVKSRTQRGVSKHEAARLVAALSFETPQVAAEGELRCGTWYRLLSSRGRKLFSEQWLERN